MGKDSGIEWTDATWNPWMGCTKVSPGCKNCYMFRERTRFGHDPTEIVRTKRRTFLAPLRWKEPLLIFVCSWSDFFHPEVPDLWRQEAMEVIYHCERHTFLILTKRPELVNALVHKDFWRINSNAWLGVSVETQDYMHRVSQLYDIPASKKFVSAEPLLGPLDFSEHMGLIDWVITGGESDYKSPRPCNLDWVRSIRDQCTKDGVAFFHKQHGGSKKIDSVWGGKELDGKIWDEMPLSVASNDES